MHKVQKSRGVLGGILGPLLKTGLPLIRNILRSLARSVLIPLASTAAAAAVATGATIHKTMFGSGNTKLIICNEKMKDIMRIVKSLEKSGVLRKGVSEKIKK